MAALPSRSDIAGTPSNATARAALTSIWDFLAGLFGSDGTAATARSSLGIGRVSYRNLLRNPAFRINQRAVSGSVVLASGAYGHDGWKAGAAGCTYTFSSSGNVTTINITAGSLIQVIEGEDIDGGNYVMSWTGSATGKIGGGSLAASGVTAAGVAAGVNLSVEFGTGTLTQVQLEPGTLPSIFERRHPSLELEICQRFYQTSYDGVAPGTASSGGRVTGVNSATGTGFFTIPVFLPVQMRATPTVVVYNHNTGFTSSIRDETNGADITAGASAGSSARYFRITNTLPIAAVAHILSAHYTASAEL